MVTKTAKPSLTRLNRGLNNRDPNAHIILVPPYNLAFEEDVIDTLQ